MADPEAEHGFFWDDDWLLSYGSPFFDYGWDENDTPQNYLNRVAPDIADDVEFRLGINERQERFHIDIPLHPNFQALIDLAPPRLTDEERMAQILRYALPRPTGGIAEPVADPEPLQGSQMTYTDIGCLFLISAVILVHFW